MPAAATASMAASCGWPSVSVNADGGSSGRWSTTSSVRARNEAICPRVTLRAGANRLPSTPWATPHQAMQSTLNECAPPGGTSLKVPAGILVGARRPQDPVEEGGDVEHPPGGHPPVQPCGPACRSDHLADQLGGARVRHPGAAQRQRAGHLRGGERGAVGEEVVPPGQRCEDAVTRGREVHVPHAVVAALGVQPRPEQPVVLRRGGDRDEVGGPVHRGEDRCLPRAEVGELVARGDHDRHASVGDGGRERRRAVDAPEGQHDDVGTTGNGVVDRPDDPVPAREAPRRRATSWDR
jgi:hypothetical protein